MQRRDDIKLGKLLKERMTTDVLDHIRRSDSPDRGVESLRIPEILGQEMSCALLAANNRII